jgi:pimeloyl-ACP methyl ester carboxylesterase
MRAALLASVCTLLAACTTVPPREGALIDPAAAYLDGQAGGGVYREGWAGEGSDRIHYVEAGTGPTVLFVHGFPSFWYAWADQLEAFRGCRRVIAIDAPGSGLSARPVSDDGYRVANLAARLDRLIAKVAPNERITLVGHDWGGALAWSYAEWKPDRLERVAVFSAPPYDLFLELVGNDPEQRARSSYMQALRGLDKSAIAERGVAARLYQTAYAAMVAKGVLNQREGDLFRAALSDEAVDGGVGWYRANIPSFDAIDASRDAWPSPGARAAVPVLLVEGAADRTFVPLASRARAHSAALEAVMLPGVGHWTPFEDPAAANAALGRFLGLPNGRCPAP